METLSIPRKLTLTLIACSLCLPINAKDTIEVEWKERALPAWAWGGSLKNVKAKKLIDEVSLNIEFYNLFANTEKEIKDLIKDTATIYNPVIGRCDHERDNFNSVVYEEGENVLADGVPDLCPFKYAEVTKEGIQEKGKNDTNKPFAVLDSDICNKGAPYDNPFIKTAAFKEIDGEVTDTCYPTELNEACVLEYATVVVPKDKDETFTDYANKIAELSRIGVSVNKDTEKVLFDTNYGQHGECGGGGFFGGGGGAAAAAAAAGVVVVVAAYNILDSDNTCVPKCVGGYWTCGKTGSCP